MTEPEELSGMLMKLSPCVWRMGAYQPRHITIKGGMFCWFLEGEERGRFDFREQGIICHTHEYYESRFCMRSARGWSSNCTFTEASENRVFHFDTKGSEHTRDVWVKAIGTHAHHYWWSQLFLKPLSVPEWHVVSKEPEWHDAAKDADEDPPLEVARQSVRGFPQRQFASFSENDGRPMEHVKTLRLCSLANDGHTLVIESVDMEIDDTTFGEVGVCSYSWGFNRTSYIDKETGLAWETSIHSETMARAALKFFKKVWIDGLCIIQCLDWHKTANLAIMGQIYWHGCVVTETFMGMSPSYGLRGWVQQEIKYTRVMYTLKPLVDFIDKYRSVDGKNWEVGELPENHRLSICNKMMEELQPYLVLLQRMLDGRRTGEAIELNKKVDTCFSKIMRAMSMYGNFQHGDLNEFLDVGLPLIGTIPREDASDVNLSDGILQSALEAYRCGWFSFNNDRLVASFGLASYVLGCDIPLVQTKVDALPAQIKLGMININPDPFAGRWCVGLGPEVQLCTRPYAELKADASVDAVLKALYGEEAFGKMGCQKVIGWKHEKGMIGPNDECFVAGVGVRVGPGHPICCIASALMTEEKDWVVYQMCMDFGSKMVALLNCCRFSCDHGESAYLEPDGDHYRIMQYGVNGWKDGTETQKELGLGIVTLFGLLHDARKIGLQTKGHDAPDLESDSDEMLAWGVNSERM